jgi:hypothetical protein
VPNILCSNSLFLSGEKRKCNVYTCKIQVKLAQPPVSFAEVKVKWQKIEQPLFIPVIEHVTNSVSVSYDWSATFIVPVLNLCEPSLWRSSMLWSYHSIGPQGSHLFTTIKDTHGNREGCLCWISHALCRDFEDRCSALGVETVVLMRLICMLTVAACACWALICFVQLWLRRHSH